MLFLRESTASQIVQLGPFLDDADGKTPETALSISNTDIKLNKHAGTTHISKNSGGGTHIALGYYQATLDATDTNTIGRLVVLSNMSGALPVKHEFMVLPAQVYDSLVLASDKLLVDAVEINSSATSAANLQKALLGVVPASVATDAGNSSTQIKSDLTETTDNHYNGRMIVFTSGAMLGQATRITDYTGSTKILQVDALTETPADGVTFVIV